MYFTFLSENENKEIDSFSSTPNIPVKQKDLTEAETEIREDEKETQKTDTEYRKDNSYKEVETEEPGEQEEPTEKERSEETDTSNKSEDDDIDYSENLEDVKKMRFLSKLEYGSPDGLPLPPCPGCTGSNADVGDAAIIDASIVPVKDTSKEENNADVTAEMRMIFASHKLSELSKKSSYTIAEERFVTNCYKEFVPGQESIPVISTAILSALKILLTATIVGAHALATVAVALYKVALVIIDVIKAVIPYVTKSAKWLFVSTEQLMILYRKKLKRLLGNVDENALITAGAVECFPFDIWISNMNTLLEIHEDLLKSDQHVFYGKEKEHKDYFNNISRKFEKIGVDIDFIAGTIDETKYRAKLVLNDVITLQFTPPNMSKCAIVVDNVNRFCKIKNDAKIVKLLSGFSSVVSKISKNIRNINAEDTAQLTELAEQELRTKFVAHSTELVYAKLTDGLKMFVEVCQKYEEAMDDTNKTNNY